MAKYDYYPSFKKKPKFLTPEQADKLLKRWEGKNIYQYIFISLNTGARISEVCGLKWTDVDLENRIVQIHGKGSKERTVPIPRGLYKFLKERKSKDDSVVTGSTVAADVTCQFRKYADQAGLHEFTFHKLRDTYASWLAQNGIDLKIIQELLGHESIHTTLIYAHLSPDSCFQTVGVVDSLLKRHIAKDESRPITKA